MQKQAHITIGSQKMRQATWLPLLALAWLQLSLASHQFDHVAEYYSDSCHVCAHLDRVEDVATDSSAADRSVYITAIEPVATQHANAYRSIVRQYDSRAPPKL